MFQLISSCWSLLCWNKKGQNTLHKSCLVLSCPAERDRNACREGPFTPSVRVNMADDRRQIL